MPPLGARRPGRLTSLHDKPSRGPRNRKPPVKVTETAKQCPACKSTNLEEADGVIVCQECYTQVSESNIVAEVTFEEQSGGRATVQGGTVHENARHAKTMGPGAARTVGGERNTLADVQNAGRRALAGLCPRLAIEDSVQVQAENIWTLAANINFGAGRKTDEVVAACLYAACRRQRDNKILLMDIAEVLKINVFRLGEVYKDMCKQLYLKDEKVGHQYLQELEPLIKKYCDKLQFADKTRIVAEDALKIIRRMNRDWIVAGRHPAGLCSACIILAARMNNFNRSVRELVYVSKVADATIAKRVEEFRRTKSSALTIDLFREYANRIKHQHDPPSLFLAQEKQRIMNNRKRKREEHIRSQTMARDSQEHEQSQQRQSQEPIEIPDNGTDVSSRLSSVESELPEVDDLWGQKKRQRLEDPTQSTDSVPAQIQTGQVEGLQPTPPATQDSIEHKPDDGDRGEPSADPADLQNGVADQHQRTEDSPPASMQQERRLDSDGFAIPSLPASAVPLVPVVPAMAGSGAQVPTGPMPVSPTLGPHASATSTSPPAMTSARNTPAPEDRDDSTMDEIAPPKKRGRKKFEPPTIDLSQEELDVEDYLEQEIEKMLEDGDVQDSQSEVEKAKENERYDRELENAKLVAADRLKLEKEKSKERREALGHKYDDDEEDLEKLFENDMEVEYCILKPHEVKIKEQIWVAHNEDWLRKQAEKDMMAQVAKATGTSTRGRKRKDGKPMGRRKKRAKMGDGTLLTEASTPVETPADAARLVLVRHAPSTNIDFTVLSQVLGPQADSLSSRNTSADQTRQATPRGTPAPPSEATAEGGASEPARSPAASADGDEDEGDENDEPEQMTGWDTINDDPDPEDDDDMDDEQQRNRLLARLSNPNAEADEFGFVPGDDFEGSGDEYE